MQNGWTDRDVVSGVDSWGPKNHVLAGGAQIQPHKSEGALFWGEGGSNTWAYPDLTAVHILNLIRKGAAAMRPLATSTVATCLVVALALDVSGSSQSVTDNNG